MFRAFFYGFLAAFLCIVIWHIWAIVYSFSDERLVDLALQKYMALGQHKGEVKAQKIARTEDLIEIEFTDDNGSRILTYAIKQDCVEAENDCVRASSFNLGG
jgi:hypothetical protein